MGRWSSSRLFRGGLVLTVVAPLWALRPGEILRQSTGRRESKMTGQEPLNQGQEATEFRSSRASSLVELVHRLSKGKRVCDAVSAGDGIATSSPLRGLVEWASGRAAPLDPLQVHLSNTILLI